MDRKKAKKRKARRKNLFYWCIIALPVLQFLIFYIGVNLNSFALAFQTFDYQNEGLKFVGFDNLFANFINVFNEIMEKQYIQTALKNSIVLYLISLLVGTTLALLFSYYIYKKARFSKIFQIILFLPSIISGITMVIIYKYFAEISIPELIYKFTGGEIEGLLSNPNTEFAAIVFFNIWVGFGVSTLIYSSAMSGISPEIEEAAMMDGITPLKEFFLIDVPLIAPTVSVFIISSTATIFMNQMSLFSFYGANASNYDIWTIGYYMYSGISSSTTTLADYPYYAAFGLLFTFITIPITLLIRRVLTKADSE